MRSNGGVRGGLEVSHAVPSILQHNMVCAPRVGVEAASRQRQRARRPAKERVSALVAGKPVCSKTQVKKVLVVIEEKWSPESGEPRLEKGVYVLDTGVGTEAKEVKVEVKGQETTMSRQGQSV
ncbi:hypothetical protein NDU88_001801 [Pleurodeles waltl]|uniref:Uncharacterized protein n=1 Tax=Pleurodeles waltl TaxID=8319 RepID=A0AAV7P521_PLEWA|nr:hypothetical protein NDU88_001801 [Pleurodeles waltl]